MSRLGCAARQNMQSKILDDIWLPCLAQSDMQCMLEMRYDMQSCCLEQQCFTNKAFSMEAWCTAG